VIPSRTSQIILNSRERGGVGLFISLEIEKGAWDIDSME